MQFKTLWYFFPDNFQNVCLMLKIQWADHFEEILARIEFCFVSFIFVVFNKLKNNLPINWLILDYKIKPMQLNAMPHFETNFIILKTIMRIVNLYYRSIIIWS